MFKSIFSRLFWTYSIIILTIFVIISAVMGIVLNSYVFRQQENDILAASSVLEQMTGAYQIEETDIRARNAYKQSLHHWSKFVHGEIIVTNNEGEVSEATGTVRTVPKEFVDEVIQKDKPIRIKSTFNGSYPKEVFTVGVPVRYNGSTVGAMFFNIYMSQLKSTLMGLLSAFLITILTSMVIAFALLYIQAKKISKPIHEINNAARDIAAGNFSHRVTVSSNDEVGQLASSFNFMADSIEETEKTRSRFVSDVSHELRTPMTSITGFVGGILDGTVPEDKRDYYLNIVLEESIRLTKLVNDLLDMSKMASSEYKLNVSKFDINELIRICIIGLSNKLEEKNLDLDVNFSDEEQKVIADRDAIMRVVINLIDNAIKFSYSNTKIGIKTWSDKNKINIQVGNFGSGIDRSDLSNVFKRFYKTDKSRNNKSGAGLGLSFVKDILNLHKQSIWVQSDEAKEGSNAKYTTFTFTLEKA